MVPFESTKSFAMICISSLFAKTSSISDGKRKYRTKIHDEVFIGSNSSLVAPVTIGEKSVVGAGSVITKNVRKKSLALTRAQQIEKKNYKKN